MFHNPLFMPIALGIIVMGLFYLIVSRQAVDRNSENQAAESASHWQVQCPQCNRWKQLEPIRQEEMPNRPNFPEINMLLSAKKRLLYEYKCPFCGHTWEEQYAAEQ